MLFDWLIPNMMFFYGLYNYKTTNTYPITLGEILGTGVLGEGKHHNCVGVCGFLVI